MSDLPHDTTLGTEMEKLSGLVKPLADGLRGEPAEAARSEADRGLGLAERSAGLVDDTHRMGESTLTHLRLYLAVL